MNKLELDINSLSQLEKNIYISESWCSKCHKADLGINYPKLYIEENKKYISGNCNICNEICISEIIETHVNL